VPQTEALGLILTMFCRSSTDHLETLCQHPIVICEGWACPKLKPTSVGSMYV